MRVGEGMRARVRSCGEGVKQRACGHMGMCERERERVGPCGQGQDAGEDMRACGHVGEGEGEVVRARARVTESEVMWASACGRG